MDSTALENGVSTVAEVESTPQGVVKRWCAEWDMADKAEKEWRDEAKKVWELYQSQKAADNTFNIFWSNVETLRPAVYNSTPRPDVRRRFRDADPQGKVAATILERGLTFQLDHNDFNHEIESLVLDFLVVGRGLARELYVPVFGDLEGEIEGEWLDEAEPAQEILDQTGATRHVSWDDFRRGPGKKWAEVPWIGFRHQMTYDSLVRQFGKAIADQVPLSQCPDDAKQYPKDVGSLLKVAEVYEIWDKASRRCLFICPGYKDGPLHAVDDPLKLVDFWPIPRPIYAIEDTTTLVPAIPYKKYEQQARELNRITARINKVVNALKVRGAYAAHLSEVGQIIQAEDNVMVPITNASEIANMGGLDKAIWIMPIEKLVTVLQGLYEARAQTVQSIYEITGLGDVMRGVSNPHETLGAQQMKSQYGSMRIQRIQRDIQRFIRDLLKIKAEIIAEQFEPETLEGMTGIQLPTDEEKAALQQQMAMIRQQMQPGMMGAPPQVDPAVGEQIKQAEKILALPSWGEIMRILRSDVLRQYRMDIETDSTIQETVNRDAQGLQEAITAIGALFATVAPAVKEGYLSVDVVKTLAAAVSRTARAGQAVEDAIDMIEQPPPQPGMDPAQQKMLEDAQKNIQAGQKEIESGKAELQKISQGLREEKMGLEGQKVKTEVEVQKQLGAIEKAKMDFQREVEKQAAALEKQARDLEVVKQEIEMARKLLQSEEQIRKAERGTEEAKLEAHFTKKETALAGQGLAVEKQGVEQKGKEVESKAKEVEEKSADSEKVAKLSDAINEGLAKIAEMQKSVSEQQAAQTAKLEEVVGKAKKPAGYKLKKGPDGTWDVKTND